MIKRLVIKDCLGIEELAINPGKVNVISGGNEKGKTSILETIEKALFNTKRRAKFVRTGAEKAYIELDTEDISIRRTVKEDEAGLDTGSVKVTKAGLPVKAPETFLKELFGYQPNRGIPNDVFAFNPVDFMQKKDTEQTNILLSLLPIHVTPEEAKKWFGEAPKVNYEKHGLQVLKALEEWFYEARREANSRVKATDDEIVAVSKRLPDNYKLQDWEKVSLAAMYSNLEGVREINRDIEEYKKIVAGYQAATEAIDNKYSLQEKDAQEEAAKEIEVEKEAIEAKRKTLQGNIDYIDSQIDELKEQIRKLEGQKALITDDIRELDSEDLDQKKKEIARVTSQKLKNIANNRKEELARLDTDKRKAETMIETLTPTDTAPMEAQCAETERMKSFVPLAKEVEGLQAKLEEELKTAQHYDTCVETARTKPRELLSKIELPIKDLGVDGKGIVTIKGLPLSNLSTAQQVRTCLDIARALAKNTPLKLICVDKLEHLDETIRKEFLKQIETDTEWQYFITIVTDGDLKVETK